MTISVGEKLPDAKFTVSTGDGPAQLSTDDVFAGKTVVLFGVPGAFTPTCSMNHLPGFIEHHDAIKAKGVDTIAVVAVNDVFVMKAWENATGGKDKILYLADGSGAFAKATGLDIDLGAAGLGIRCKRFSMIVEDGTVSALNIEDTPGKAEASSALGILAQLGEERAA
ncbi:MAG: peroxiredoxin [Phyllobacteriaceae bacterium]|mgnify:CR=1 FL=1|nr:peroxiredoxin [Phyllobacteriaceae bacterium]MBA91822.1 peroxiredoxin [Phyllobacteriaceae bacterium]